MQSVDRLGWAAGTVFAAYGLRIGVRVSDASVLEQVRARFPYGWRSARGPEVTRLFSLRVGGKVTGSRARQFHVVFSGFARLYRSEDWDEALDALESALRREVAEHAPRHVFLHAGVVAFGGKALLIPGRSFSGKSTLVAALVRAGATYYSDEFAVLGEDGRVRPFLKPLSLRAPGETKQAQVPVESLGGVVGRTPLEVGAVLITRHEAGSLFKPVRLSGGQLALELLNNAVAARVRPRAVMTLLHRVTREARGFATPRPEASSMVPELLRLLESNGR